VNNPYSQGALTDVRFTQYHDDGEESLGPVIATLSLGGSATMTFKMKDRYYKGLTKTGRYNPMEFVPPGAALYNERRALNQLYGTMPNAQFDILRRQMYANNPAALKSNPVLVTAHLLHGDIIIMNGAAMQKYYVVSNVDAAVQHLSEPLTNPIIAQGCVDWQSSFRVDLPSHQEGVC